MKNTFAKTLAVILAASALSNAAEATTIYDKDGTTLGINGRIRARLSNGDIGPYPTPGKNSGTLTNNARFGVEGTTVLTDGIKAFAFTQWDAADGNYRDKFAARDQYLGVDFNKYGKLTFGRFLSPVYDTLSGTDIHYDFTGQLLADNNRRPGQIKYSFASNGFSGAFALQTATDGASVGYEKKIDINEGFSTNLAYTFDDALFGPLTLKAGYEYFNGQNEPGDKSGDYDSIKIYAAGLVWGILHSGPYVALSYSEADHNVKSYFNDFKIRGFESALGYGFDNGIYADIGYVWQKYEPEDKSKDNSNAQTRGIIATVAWDINPHFVVDFETYFSLKSSGEERHSSAKGGDYYSAPYNRHEHAAALNLIYFL